MFVLAEQDGVPERALKARLVDVFRDLGSVSRAYLLSVKMTSDAKRSVALCLLAAASEREKIVSRVQAEFSAQFKPSEFLDIVFVSVSKDAELYDLCKPFFEQTVQTRPRGIWKNVQGFWRNGPL